MRRPFVAGNWKMNTTIEEATALVKGITEGLETSNSIDIVLCPPFVSLHTVGGLVEGTHIEVGAQNMYYKEKGAFTGEISPTMLKGLSKYVILGHSERRQLFHETDDMINQKVKAAITAGLLPILCVGETLEENEDGKTENILTKQVKAALTDVQAHKAFIIAYEPIWAIGTGKASTGRQAGKSIGFIRETVKSIWGTETADSVRILYGGSVTASNTAEFMVEPEIDGALVGGASLKAKEFIEIVKHCTATKSGT